MLLPFLLTSLIAVHVMPSHGADGAMVMVICTTDGPQTVTIDPATGEPVETDDHSAQSPCHWACTNHAMALTARVTLPSLTGRAVALGQPPAPFTLTAARATGLPPSTGPPFAA